MDSSIAIKAKKMIEMGRKKKTESMDSLSKAEWLFMEQQGKTKLASIAITIVVAGQENNKDR